MDTYNNEMRNILLGVLLLVALGTAGFFIYQKVQDNKQKEIVLEQKCWDDANSYVEKLNKENSFLSEGSSSDYYRYSVYIPVFSGLPYNKENEITLVHVSKNEKICHALIAEDLVYSFTKDDYRKNKTNYFIFDFSKKQRVIETGFIDDGAKNDLYPLKNNKDFIDTYTKLFLE